MTSGPSLEALFERGRPAAHGLEIDQVVGSLHEHFGVGARPPVIIGRYRVAGRLGAGGLGIVYRGYDPSLARFVAIKVLKRGKEAAKQDVRLLREARVLARIRHPHVVEVFDVGFFEDHGRQRFFVAMELVEGIDLRRWLMADRAPGAIRAAFGAAAEGLAAAHAAGLLHRDFKPSNVLMGEDGAVKVADFGLAAMTQDLQDDPSTTSGPMPDPMVTLWRPGGTLDYMSPEQQRGEALTPATDQYSFCVSLHEAVYGFRPFREREREALLRAKERGPRLRREPRVSRAMRHLLERGLQPEPEDRFDSMEALRRALGRIDGGARRSGLAVAALGGAALVTAAVLTSRDPPPPSSEPQCPSPPASLGTTLEAGLATEPAVAPILAASPPLAEAWPAVVEALEAYRAELRQRWDASCGLDEADQARVQQCLTQCGDAVAGLQEVLARGDREALAQSWSLVRSLPDVHLCTLDGHSPQQPRQGAAGAAVERARLLATAGKLDEARRVLEEVRVDTVLHGHDHARRYVDTELAELDSTAGRYAEAKRSLEQLYFEAASDGDTLAAARASVRLVYQGYRSGDVEAALKWGRTAHTELERMRPRDYELETVLWHNMALIHLVAGDLGEALTMTTRALEHASAPGVSERLRLSVLQLHAELLLLNGRPAEALEIHEQQLHTRQTLPQRDPMTSVVNLQSLGNTLMTLHDLRGAWVAYRNAFELGTTVLGPAHPHTLSACISYAWAQGDRGNPEQGQQSLAPCLERLALQLGEHHPNVSLARAMAGRLASQRGEAEQARRLLQGALESLEHNFGPSHYAVGDVLHELGLARATAGNPAAGLGLLRRALQVREAVLPAGHVNRAETLAALGRLEQAHGDPATGRAHLREAIEIFEARRVDADYLQGLREELDGGATPPPEQAPERAPAQEQEPPP